MALLAAITAGAAVSTLFVAAMRPAGAGVLRARMQRLWAPQTESEQEDPFSARVLKPMSEAVMRSASRLLPQRLISAVEMRIQTADMTVSALPFVSVWLGVGVAIPAVLFILLTAAGAMSMPFLMLLGAWAVFGGIFPWRILSGRATTRTKQIDQELPDAIDMIVTSVEAGLGMQQAMMTVADQFVGSISIEFGRVLAETLTYLRNNQSRMDYPRYRCEGLPVTSALIESLVKEMNYRVKGTEKFWNDGPSGEAILQVRAALLSDDDRLAKHLRSRPGCPYARKSGKSTLAAAA